MTEPTQQKRRGRPPAAPGTGKTEAVLLRLTPEQRRKFDALGNGQERFRAWLEKQRV
jgi:hypothetical protein